MRLVQRTLRGATPSSDSETEPSAGHRHPLLPAHDDSALWSALDWLPPNCQVGFTLFGLTGKALAGLELTCLRSLPLSLCGDTIVETSRDTQAGVLLRLPGHSLYRSLDFGTYMHTSVNLLGSTACYEVSSAFHRLQGRGESGVIQCKFYRMG